MRLLSDLPTQNICGCYALFSLGPKYTESQLWTLSLFSNECYYYTVLYPMYGKSVSQSMNYLIYLFSS